MCNRYGYNHPISRLVEEFSDVGPIRWAGLEPNAALDQIRPTDRAPIIRDVGGEMALDTLRWGLVPNTWRGPVKGWMAQLRGNPLTNARSETVATTSTFRDAYAARRCLVPATEYFEWTTDPERPKSKKLMWQSKKLMWRFTVPAQETFAFPGIWDHTETAEGPLDSFALLTSAPGADQAPYHNRQPVILERAQWADWLNPSSDLAPTFKGSPAATIAVERFTEASAQATLGF
jgi:putative SOS response-associated peptidase YedK